MSDPRPVRGVVVGHGDMARGLVDAVRHIAGDVADGLTPVSNEGRGPDQLKTDLDAAAGLGPAVVFADLQFGSCGIAASYSCRDSARRVVICGVNLPMLLEFVLHRDLPLDELVTRLVETGREAIRPAPSVS